MRVANSCEHITGHVREWAKRILENEDNVICFVGYSGKGTLSDKIINQKDKNISFDGVTCIRRCKIKQYNTFSSHIQQKEIIDYFKQISIGQMILLHHGNMDAREELKEEAIKQLGEVGKSVKIVVIDKNNNTFFI